MTPSARLAAAIDILTSILQTRRPVAEALKDWGLHHRFAGSRDRAAIADLVYDALRRQASSAHLMREESARAILLGMLRLQKGLSLQAIVELCQGAKFAPEPLTPDEQICLESGSLEDAPLAVAGDCPEWLIDSLTATYGDATLAELQALSARAPLDLRVNALKASREQTLKQLAHLPFSATPLASQGLRLTLADNERMPALQSEPEFLKGWFEVQDEGSQLAALLCGAKAGEQVVDLCAGGGGKTLSLAAQMQNKGQIFATDSDPRRLAPIHERLKRAGARNVQVRTPRGGNDPLQDLEGRMDRVLVDAPCTGTGTWRRNPDIKWRLRPNSLELRRTEQQKVLERASRLVRSGGLITYITCSLLREENDQAIETFLDQHAGFSCVEAALVLERSHMGFLKDHVLMTRHGIQMTPWRTKTDGFYVSVLVKE